MSVGNSPDLPILPEQLFWQDFLSCGQIPKNPSGRAGVCVCVLIHMMCVHVCGERGSLLDTGKNTSAVSKALTPTQRHSPLCVRNVLLASLRSSVILDSLPGDVILTDRMRRIPFLPQDRSV